MSKGPTPSLSKQVLIQKSHPLTRTAYAHNDVSACGTVIPQKSLSKSYTVHPTIMDASFHLGASLNSLSGEAYREKSNARKATKATLRVPTSFGVYATVRESSRSTNYWASVADVNQQSYDMITSSYKLGNYNDTSTNDVVHMVAKPFRKFESMNSSTNPKSKRTHLMYILQWKAVGVTESPERKSMLSKPLQWHKLSREGRHMWKAGLGIKTSMYTCATKFLEIVRRILMEETWEGSHCQLLGTIHSCSLSRPCISIEANIVLATALSFLRSAAQEQQKSVWQATLDSALNFSPGIAVPWADAFGVQRTGSFALQAQLLPVLEKPEPYHRETMFTQDVLIIGGLGDIGMLVGSWANACMAGHICIASRSGHPSTADDSIVSLMQYVTVCRCDIACVEEAINFGLPKATLLRIFMHAGELATFACTRIATLTLCWNKTLDDCHSSF